MNANTHGGSNGDGSNHDPRIDTDKELRLNANPAESGADARAGADSSPDAGQSESLPQMDMEGMLQRMVTTVPRHDPTPAWKADILARAVAQESPELEPVRDRGVCQLEPAVFAQALDPAYDAVLVGALKPKPAYGLAALLLIWLCIFVVKLTTPDTDTGVDHRQGKGNDARENPDVAAVMLPANSPPSLRKHRSSADSLSLPLSSLMAYRSQEPFGDLP